MAPLRPMPGIVISQADLAAFGRTWTEHEKLSRTPPYSSIQFGELLNRAVGQAIAAMLGNIPIVTPNNRSLLPAERDCVEVGPVRIVGGVRAQNFDVGYRPDGVRFVFDSKTLNDKKSLGKNWQNMVNDLATEATSVHSRFPYAVVAFMVAIPGPAFVLSQRAIVVHTLERLGRRATVHDPPHMAEAISLVVWNPEDGTIDDTIPKSSSPLRIERFSDQIELAYTSRYEGYPPHSR